MPDPQDFNKTIHFQDDRPIDGHPSGLAIWALGSVWGLFCGLLLGWWLF